MKRSLIPILLTFAVACGSDSLDKQDGEDKGWKLGGNNSDDTTNNTNKNNGGNNGVTNGNNGITGSSNNLTSGNNVTPNNNGVTNGNNGTTGSSNNQSPPGLPINAECDVNSECQSGTFCCPQGFEDGPGMCETSCRATGGRCGGNDAECNQPFEGCCEQLGVCAEQCADNPTGDVCNTNPDCSNGQLCCPSLGGGDSTCSDDCGVEQIGGLCENNSDCSGSTPMCCNLPIGENLCLQQCGF